MHGSHSPTTDSDKQRKKNNCELGTIVVATSGNSIKALLMVRRKKPFAHNFNSIQKSFMMKGKFQLYFELC